MRAFYGLGPVSGKFAELSKFAPNSPSKENKVPQFTDQNISKLFGAEAAEDESEERFRQYFFFNQTYENLKSELPLRILVGHKGVGKSALLKRGYLSDRDHKVLAIWLQPGDVSNISTKDTANFSALIEFWKQGLLAIIARHILGETAEELFDKPTIARYAGQVSNFIKAVTTKLGDRVGIASHD